MKRGLNSVGTFGLTAEQAAILENNRLIHALRARVLALEAELEAHSMPVCEGARFTTSRKAGRFIRPSKRDNSSPLTSFI